MTNAILISKGAGAEKLLSFTKKQDGSDLDITNAGISFYVAIDKDSQLAIQKHNIANGGSDSEIQITDATGGKAQLYIKEEDTESLKETRYIYQVWLTLPAKEAQMVLEDRFTVNKSLKKG